MMRGSRSILVPHTGALGDHVMIWPLLRALLRAGNAVTLACEGSKGALAVEYLPELRAVSMDTPVFRALWLEEAPFAGSPERHDVLLCFHVGADDPGGRRWAENARRVFSASSVRHVGPPGSPSRVALWCEVEVEPLGRVEARANPDGLIVLHVGAGSHEKRWSMPRWVELHGRLCAAGFPVGVIAGEVEREKFSEAERLLFAGVRGVYVDDYARLAEVLRTARVVVAADTGPAHLAAQLGVPTLALFGPTDPNVWSPVGPRVHGLAPPSPSAMDWLFPERVMAGVETATARS